MKSHAIKEWSEEDRPREKLLLKGRSALSDAELLAIIIGSGTASKSAVSLSMEILKDCDSNLNNVSKLSISQLMKYEGIGEARATAIFALFEISRRKMSANLDKKRIIRSSKDVYEYLSMWLTDLSHEEFYALYLNRRNEVLGIAQISKGGISGTVADGKIIFHEALEKNASALILAHNHPSGSTEPSDADRKLTNSLVQFGKFIELPILDHLIFAGQDYFSFADQGIL